MTQLVRTRSRMAAVVLAVAAASATAADAARAADRFAWTLDPASTVTTTITASYSGFSASDTKTTGVTGTFGGVLGLPAYDFASVLLDQANVGYASNPTFNLSFGSPVFGGVTVTTNGLGFALPGPNGKSTIPTTPFPVSLSGAFTQTGTAVEGRGTMSYAGSGIIGSGVGSGSIALLDLSPIPGELSGTLTQVGNQIRLTTPLTLDQTTTLDNGVVVRAQVSGSIVANATTNATGWKVDANGSSETPANWSSGQTPYAGTTSRSTAVFGHVISAPRTISGFTSARTAIFDSDVSYNLSGTLSIGGGGDGGPTPTLFVRSGSHRAAVLSPMATPMRVEVAAGAQFTADSVNGSGDLEVAGAGRLVVANGSSPRLYLRGGTLAIGTLYRVGSPSIDAVNLVFDGGTIDLGASGRFEAGYTTYPTAPSKPAVQLENFRLALRSGYANGTWTGVGLTSSALPGDGRRAIGYADRLVIPAASYGGQTPYAGIVSAITLKGDADLDFDVDFADLLALAKHYNASAAHWTDGDFDYDGTVAFRDLLALAKNYNAKLPSGASAETLNAGFAADWALAQSLVPEPALLGMIGMGLGCIAVRRRQPRV